MGILRGSASRSLLLSLLSSRACFSVFAFFIISIITLLSRTGGGGGGGGANSRAELMLLDNLVEFFISSNPINPVLLIGPLFFSYNLKTSDRVVTW